MKTVNLSALHGCVFHSVVTCFKHWPTLDGQQSQGPYVFVVNEICALKHPFKVYGPSL